MSRTTDELVSQIAASITDNALGEDACSAVDELSRRDDALDAVSPIIELIAANPEVDFGMPGPLVHFVEKCYRNGYEQRLLASVEANPSSHTMWMLNRLINGARDEEKEILIDLLRAVAGNSDVDDQTRETAKQFVSHHAR